MLPGHGAVAEKAVAEFGLGISFISASNSGYQTAQSTYSWSHTCSGSDRFLAVDVEMFSVPGTTVSSITFNGDPLSLIGVKSTVSGAGRVECWGLAAPDAGTFTIAVTLSASIASAGTAVSYAGVHQTTPTEAFNSAQATNVGAADATANVTTVADNDWVHAAVSTDDSSITANQTSRNNVTGALGSGANEDTGPKTPAGSVAMSYTGIGALATWAIGGYALRPVAALNETGSGAASFSVMAVGTSRADKVASGAASFSFTAAAAGGADIPGSGAALSSFTAAANYVPFVNICGFEIRSLIECADSSGTVSVQNTTARNGGYALRCNPTLTTVGYGVIKALATDGTATNANAATSYFRFYFRYGVEPGAASNILRVSSTSGVKAELYFDRSNAGVVDLVDASSALTATGTTVLTINTWYLFELKIGTSATAGDYELKINGNIEFSGSTNLGANKTVSVSLGSVSSFGPKPIDYFYDDFSWSDSFYPTGDRIDAVLPNAAGTNQAFTRGGTDTGNNWDQVNELPSDDVSYLSSTADGDKESEKLDASAIVGDNIACIKAWHYCRRDAGSDSTARLLVRSNTTEVLSNSSIYTSSYKLAALIYDTDPATSAGWINASLDTLEVGTKDVSDGDLRMDACGAMIYWTATYDTGSGSASFNFTATATSLADKVASGAASCSFAAAGTVRADGIGSGVSTFQLTTAGVGRADVIGSGSSSFSFTAAATGIADIIGSGAAAFSFTAAATSLADIAVSGASSFSFTVSAAGLADVTGNGAASFSFAAAAASNADAAASGAASFSFSADGVGRADATGSGAVSFSFTAEGGSLADKVASGAGSFSFTVDAVGLADITATGAAEVSFTVAATGAADITGSGTTSFSFTASAVGVTETASSGTASFSFTVAGVGLADIAVSGASTFVFTADGGGRADATATGAASFSLSVAGASAADKVATGATDFLFTATAAGAADVTGSGASTVTFTAIAAGVADTTGSGSASFSFAAASVGRADATGAGASSFAFAVAGQAVVESDTGSGSSSVAFTAAGAGIADKVASGAASVSFTASAVGRADVAASGASSFSFTAAAAVAVSGTGSAAFGFGAEAVGLTGFLITCPYRPYRVGDGVSTTCMIVVTEDVRQSRIDQAVVVPMRAEAAPSALPTRVGDGGDYRPGRKDECCC